MKKFDDIFKMSDIYNEEEIKPYWLIGGTKEDSVYQVLIDYSVYEKDVTYIYFSSEFDLTIFKHWLLDKNEEVYCVNHPNGCEEYIFKKHILSVDITKGELLSCYNKLYFGIVK